MIHPSDLGAPDHLGVWRPAQARAFEWMLGSGRRFDLGNLPVGVGKSLLGWTYARILNARAVILTATKGLMDQYEHAGLPGMRGHRGMNNFPCRALDNRQQCDKGPCLDGEQCSWRNGGCSYFDSELLAREEDIVVTNYAYWFSHPPNEDGSIPSVALGPRDLLICDEAHAIPEEIMGAAGAEFTADEIDLSDEMIDWPLWKWQEWAAELREQRIVELRSEGLDTATRRQLRSEFLRFSTIARMDLGSWAHEIQRYPRKLVRFEPIAPLDFAESLLFRGISKVVMLSGTARQTMMPELGIGMDEYSYLEVPSPFPTSRRPIYHLRTGLRVRGEMSETNMQFLVSSIDQVINSRKAWKGIIHGVSYKRSKYIYENSRFASSMIFHDALNTRAAVERFKRAAAPAILVSPSVHTGWDFPYDAARWQIIAKAPIPDARWGIARARAQHDKQYIYKHAITSLQQIAGRVMRADDDWGETIIMDDSMDWLYGHYRSWYAQWWREAYRAVNVLPAPPQIPPRGVLYGV